MFFYKLLPLHFLSKCPLQIRTSKTYNKNIATTERSYRGAVSLSVPKRNQTNKQQQILSQSTITIIPKQNKDLTILDNWRPISLLNVDYKLKLKLLQTALNM